MRQLKTLTLTLLLGLGSTLSLAGWNPLAEQQSAEQRQRSHQAAQQAVAAFKQADPKLQVFFDQAYAYVVFPAVGKGGMGIGGAFGRGLAYRQGQHVGNTSLTQISVGFQFGGQAYREIIFFKDRAAFDRFRSGSFELSAQASAVAVTAGAAANVDYSDGVAIFTQTKAGLMYEASVGGQKFSYQAIP